MKILVLLALAAATTADVSHIFPPATSYGVPQGSIQSLSRGSLGLGSVQDFNQQYYGPQQQFDIPVTAPSGQLNLPSSQQLVSFQSGFSTPSPIVSISTPSSIGLQSYDSGFSTTASPLGSLSGFSSTESPLLNQNIDLSLLQGVVSSTPSPLDSNFGLNFQSGFSSTPSPLNVNLGSLQTRYNVPLGLSGLTSIDSNLFNNDAALNSGLNLVGRTSGGSLNDAFGVHTTVGPITSDLAGLGLGSISQESSYSSNAQVSKHLYFFAAPEDEEIPQPRINLPVAPPKKNVKIIFIKAPAYKSPAPVQVPVVPQNEEKTLVYVLVKKSEQPGPIEVQTPPPTQPSKPEVYFIKYKNQKDADEAVLQVQNQHGTEGVVTSNLDGLNQGGLIQQSLAGLNQGNLNLAGRLGVVETSTPLPIVTSTLTPTILGLGNVGGNFNGFGGNVDLSGLNGGNLGLSSINSGNLDLSSGTLGISNLNGGLGNLGGEVINGNLGLSSLNGGFGALGGGVVRYGGNLGLVESSTPLPIVSSTIGTNLGNVVTTSPQIVTVESSSVPTVESSSVSALAGGDLSTRLGVADADVAQNVISQNEVSEVSEGSSPSPQLVYGPPK